SPAGSDTNSGSMSAPFQTLGRARDVVRTVNANMTQDITVYLRGGTYAIAAPIAFGTQDSGTNGHRVHYQAYPGETPVLNGATKDETSVCVRDVVTTSDNNRGLLFQQPYGAIAQLPGWSAGFSVTGNHTIYNALELLTAAGQFFFDKTTGTLYYYPRSGED